MVQGIRNYADGLWKGLGIIVKCETCGKRITYRALDFQGVIQPGEDIEDRKWRCRHCGVISKHVRYTTIEKRERESLAQWTPPYDMSKYPR